MENKHLNILLPSTLYLFDQLFWEISNWELMGF